jgi:hypothetical protein
VIPAEREPERSARTAPFTRVINALPDTERETTPRAIARNVEPWRNQDGSYMAPAATWGPRTLIRADPQWSDEPGGRLGGPLTRKYSRPLVRAGVAVVEAASSKLDVSRRGF